MDPSSLPYFDQYFGIWAIEPQRFAAMHGRVTNINLALHMQSGAPERARAAAGESFQRSGDVAIIELSGVLMKQASSMEESTSTVKTRRKIRAAASSQDVKAIALVIDSPGGTVAGTQALASDIAEAAKRKPVYAQIEDLGASAAYWLASQATKVFAGPTAMVGSIGTYSVIHDLSGMAAMEGIKVHVIKAGEFKGAGQPGTEITNDQLANWQMLVDSLNAHFIAGVAKGRNMSEAAVKAIADGRMHLGGEAKSLGLIDGVQSLDETINQLSIRQSPQGKAMSKRQHAVLAAEDDERKDDEEERNEEEPKKDDEEQGQQAATIQQLKAGCPGASDAFLVAQLSAGASLHSAQIAWMTAQNRLLSEQRSEAKKPGAEPLGVRNFLAQSESDPLAAWHAALEAKLKQGMPKPKAISQLVKQQPELYRSYLDTYNAQHTRSRKAS